MANKSILNFFASAAVEIVAGALGRILVDKNKDKIQKALTKQVKDKVVRECILLILFLLAMLIAYFNVCRNKSLFISSFIILAILIVQIRYLIPALRMGVLFIIDLLPGMSLVRAIDGYIMRKFPFVALAYFGVETYEAARKAYNKQWITSNRIKASIYHSIYKSVWRYWGTKIIIFLGSMILYVITVSLIFKPILIKTAMAVTGLSVYLLPLTLSIDLIFKTNLSNLFINT